MADVVHHKPTLIVLNAISSNKEVFGAESPTLLSAVGCRVTCSPFLGFEQWQVNRLDQILFQHHLFPQLKLPYDQIV